MQTTPGSAKSRILTVLQQSSRTFCRKLPFLVRPYNLLRTQVNNFWYWSKRSQWHWGGRKIYTWHFHSWLSCQISVEVRSVRPPWQANQVVWGWAGEVENKLICRVMGFVVESSSSSYHFPLNIFLSSQPRPGMKRGYSHIELKLMYYQKLIYFTYTM